MTKLHLPALGAELIAFTQEQAVVSIGVKVEGPFQGGHFRCDVMNRFSRVGRLSRLPQLCSCTAVPNIFPSCPDVHARLSALSFAIDSASPGALENIKQYTNISVVYDAFVQVVAIEAVMSVIGTTCNLNNITMDHLKTFFAFAGDTDEFATTGTEGLDGVKVDNFKHQKIVSFSFLSYLGSCRIQTIDTIFVSCRNNSVRKWRHCNVPAPSPDLSVPT